MLGFSRKIKEAVFGLLFVMTDGSGSKPKAPMRNTVILYALDWGQVLRVMMTSSYGWSKDTYRVTKHIDMVYNVTSLITLVVPRYTLFALAFLLVSISLGNAFYCGHLFRAGDVQKIGPVKLLRFLVALVVTVLFSSIMKWILIPVDCLVSDEKSFSSYVAGADGTGDECTPWEFPEIAIAIPTLVMTAVYCLFAMSMSFLSLGTNPLSSAPRFAYTGRVELKFNFMKIAVTFLPFLSDLITSVGVSVIVFILTATVMRSHLMTLPFHNEDTNKLRGGIYGSLLWLSASSVFVAISYEGDLWVDSTIQTMQWILVGCIPVAFMLGNWMVTQNLKDIQRSLDRLRGEWENHELENGSQSQADYQSQSPSARRGRGMIGRAPSDLGAETVLTRHDKNPRGAYEEFFDPSWERKRAFNSGAGAHTAARRLLCQRVEADLPFLAYVVARGLEEFPDHSDLQIFRLSLLRFVFRNTKEAATEEKKLRNDVKLLPLDLQYVLYAVERKASQDFAASTMGEGNFNAINLLEYDAGMGQARSAHLECVVAMKRFWHTINSKRAKKDLASAVSDAINRLVEFNRHLAKAQAEYQQLLDKYPQSVQLLLSYANFCDKVLNDAREADLRRKQAFALGGTYGEDEPQSKAIEDDQKSAATSTNEGVRSKHKTNFKAWSANIFGIELSQLIQTDNRVKVVLFLVIAATVVSFTLSQYWLLKDIAMRDAHLINRTGLLRAWVISSTYLLRTLQLAGLQSNEDKVASTSQTIATLAGNFQAQHRSNYEIISTSAVNEFYTERPFLANYPVAQEWQEEWKPFWKLGNDLSRRIERASQATMEDLKSQDYRVEDLNEPKQNIAWVMENAFRALLPVLEEIVVIYQKDMKNLALLTQRLVAGLTTGNVTLTVLLALMVMRGVVYTISKMTHLYLACILALSLPLATTKKMHQFYQQCEDEMKALDDEDVEKQQLIDQVDEEMGEMDPATKIQMLDEADELNESEESDSEDMRNKNGEHKMEVQGNYMLTSTVLVDRDNGPDPPRRLEKQMSGNLTEMKELKDFEQKVKGLSDQHHLRFDSYDMDLSKHSGGGGSRRGRSPKRELQNSYDDEDSIRKPLTAANLMQHLRQTSNSPSPRRKPNKQDGAFKAKLTLSVNGGGVTVSNGGQAVPGKALHSSYDVDLAQQVKDKLQNGFPARTLMRGDTQETVRSDVSASSRRSSLPATLDSTILVKKPDDVPSDLVSPSCVQQGMDGSEPWGQELELPNIQNTPSGEEGGAVEPLHPESHLPVQLSPRFADGSQGIEERLPESEIDVRDVELSSYDAKGSAVRIPSDDGAVEDPACVPSHPEPSVIEEGSLDAETYGTKASHVTFSPLAAAADDPRDKLSEPEEPTQLEEGSARASSTDQAKEVFRVAHRQLANLPDGRREQPKEELPPPKRRSSMMSKEDKDARSSLKDFRFAESFREEKNKPEPEGMGSSKETLEAAQNGVSKKTGNLSPESTTLKKSSGLRRTSNTDGEEEEILPLNEVSEQQRDIARQALLKHQPWVNKWWIHLCFVLAMIAVSMMFTIYPARSMGALVDLAPTINQAGRRRFLTRACVHLSRELVLDDGFSRMRKVDIASALNFYLQELKKADDAVRLGGGYDINTGADYRNEQHNMIMYDKGCPWRKDPTDCSTPEKPGAASNGLHHLSLTFIDTIQSVLARYGPPASDYLDDYLQNPRTGSVLLEFDNVTVSPERVALLTSDQDLVFIQNSFGGDMFTGYASIVTIMDNELRDIVEQAVSDNEILFAVTVVLTALVFYWALFRRAIAGAFREAAAARAFVARMPSYTLSQPEVNTVKHFFEVSHM